MRTIKRLRTEIEGKIYVYCRDTDTEMRFLKDAENEGFSFGGIKPTDSHPANVVAIEDENSLAHVSTVGRIAFQGAADGITRVDYANYISGDEDYLF